MELTNGEIFNLTYRMEQTFKNFNSNLPAKLLFYIMQNQHNISEKAVAIQKTKDNIMESSLSDEEKQEKLNQLASITQEVEIKEIPLDWITNDIEFTMEQMEALMFMLEKENKD